LQRQQEVRDRLSGKPGPKASSLIEMYREKERQASGGKGDSPGKSSDIVQQQQLRTTAAVKESTPLPPPPPPPSEPSLFPASIGQADELVAEAEVEAEVEGGDAEELVEPPNLDFDHGRESPYRYVHGAPLHNVVEEEEED
jgi:hypothetical protein